MRKIGFPLVKRGSSVENSEVEETNTLPEEQGVDEIEENLRERRYLWTARAFAIVCAISFCTNIILIMALFSLVPLTRVQPFYLTFENKDAQIVRITQMQPDSSLLERVAESLIRQYIVTRHSVVSDVDEMLQRWGDRGPIRWMSNDGVFAEFNQTTSEAFSRIREERLTREVNILSVYKLETNPREGDAWEAEVETIDMLPERSAPIRQIWQVRLRVQFLNKQEKWANRLKNPIGFTVVRYSITPKGNVGTVGE